MIKLDNISKDLDSFSIDNVNLNVEEKEYFVILGPTGAGKTLILELIAGLLRPDHGRIFINGDDLTWVDPNERRIGMVYQDYMLFPHYTVEENIAYGLKVKRIDKKTIKKIVDEYCDIFHISGIRKRRPQNLSGGEKQRVALARALVPKPKIILLDEPFSSVDVSTKATLVREIRKLHKEEDLTFIHVTHDFEEAVELADRICVINNGSVIQIGKSEDIFKRPLNRFVADFVGTRNIFHGRVIEKDGIKIFSVNSIDVYVNTEITGECHLSIRPEDIIISNNRIVSSARNSFQGVIEDILLKQFVCEVTVDIGIQMVIFITKRSYANLGLRTGKSVWIAFKTMEAHVF